MHVLLISYHYPPGSAVGGLRARNIAQAFRDRGHRVTVITARLPGERASLRQRGDGMEVHAIRSIPNPRFWYLALKQALHRRQAPPGNPRPAADGGESTATPAAVPRWKRWLGSALWTPDDRQGFILGAALKGLALGRSADLIYTTAPPFSAHLAGLLLRRLTGKRWAAEFRDPWTDNPWKPAHVRSRGQQAAEEWMERRVLAAADYIVAVSEGIQSILAARRPEAKRATCLLARNGIDRLDPVWAPRGSRPFRILHVGSLYHGRDPRPFLAALADVARRHQLGPEDLQVEFVGAGRWFNGASIEEEARRAGIGRLVRFVNWVPHEQARAMVSDSDLLLLLAQNQPVQVPNKLYEYLGARVPILAFADAGGESARMLQDVGGHYVLTGPDQGPVIGALEHALGLGGVAPEAPRLNQLEEWTTARQLEQLVTTLES